ncbi:MAG: alpha/beta fold hydrolase [Proteobacteria bacterium]|nr:alpha/beta fold hydrolase [Pseudomonadota bacterium]
MPHVDVNEVKLMVEERGSGAPLVCVNGLGAHLGYWFSTAERLAARHRVIIYDHRGAGRSDAPPGLYTIEQMRDDLKGLLDALGVARASLVGHSMGGSVAMSFAAAHPERVDRLVLYSTAATMANASARFIESVERVWTECPEISSGALTRIFVPWSWSPPRLADDGFIETMVALADNNPYKMKVEGFRAQMHACKTFDGTPLLARITAPTLVIGAHHDLLCPVERVQSLVDGVRGARLAISQSGHNTHLEEPDWFATQVLEHTAP